MRPTPTGFRDFIHVRLLRPTLAIGFAAVLMSSASAMAVPLQVPQSACVVEVFDAMLGSLLDGAIALPVRVKSIATHRGENAGDQAAEIADGPRELLVAFALELRDIRYRRGGRTPSTGFDCSGFVHYVFAQTLGIDLPFNSAEQFHTGTKVARSELRTGDLVFFHTRGKRVSHVGIYLGDGRFIHSPTTGERVRVDRLSARYWSRHFVGATRLPALT